MAATDASVISFPRTRESILNSLEEFVQKKLHQNLSNKLCGLMGLLTEAVDKNLKFAAVRASTTV